MKHKNSRKVLILEQNVASDFCLFLSGLFRCVAVAAVAAAAATASGFYASFYVSFYCWKLPTENKEVG